MSTFYKYIPFCSLLILLAFCTNTYAQDGDEDNILLGGIVVANDTFPMVYMDQVEIVDKLPKNWARKRRRYDKLRNNVYKVYPYAVIAADVLKDVDSNLLALGDDKKARKAYLKSIEAELKSRFKGELEDMTISQGHVLVKLIDRQTGKSCYHIIKELKGGFSAVVLQGVARIFSHNLKADYDPLGEEHDMEEIVRELEANYRYKYEYQLQQQRIGKVQRKS